MLKIDANLGIPDDEIEMTAVRSPGPGGQNVNKVSSAIHLRFDIGCSTALGDDVKQRLLAMHDRRISKSGVVVIKAARFRNQEKNRQEALRRLAELIRAAVAVPQPRKKTKLPRVAAEKRREDKARRSRLKRLRSSVDD